MSTKRALEFVNRDDEIEFLLQSLATVGENLPLIVIRSPTGFGKSTLTSRLPKLDNATGAKYCFVDPVIQPYNNAERVHGGYFIQKCAQQLSNDSVNAEWPSLSEYLSERRWKNVKEKKKSDVLSDLPGPKQLYKVAHDYVSRYLRKGKYSADEILTSDHSIAFSICVEYTEYLVRNYHVALCVRESQHIDHKSLRKLLELNATNPGASLIIEYTCETGEFHPEHQKHFLKIADSHGHFKILDLIKLGSTHLECLIRANVAESFTLSSDYYLSWNGNLRSIDELKYRVAIGTSVISAEQIAGTMGSLESALSEHISSLSNVETTILVACHSNLESLPRNTLEHVVQKVHQRLTNAQLESGLNSLLLQHKFIHRDNYGYRIQNEDVANTIIELKALLPAKIIIEKTLRDYYFAALAEHNSNPLDLFTTIRQAFRLCAKTKDALGLVRIKESLSETIRQSGDQSNYIQIVANAIESDPELYDSYRDSLIDWSASLAYEICDFPVVCKLLSKAEMLSTHKRILYANSLQEIGRHEEAMNNLAIIRKESTNRNAIITADMIEAVIVGCQGQQSRAVDLLDKLTNSEESENNPLVGYAYRFYDVVFGFPKNLEMLNKSIQHFTNHGLRKSKAHSLVPASLLTARTGDTEKARAMIAEAHSILEHEISDRHIILNNSAAIEILCNNTDYDYCVEILLDALRWAKDDFSENTILCNLAIAYAALNDQNSALDCATKIQAILDNHDFADKDIYWPTCFNLSQIFSIFRLHYESKEILNYPTRHGYTSSVNQRYWDFRYKKSSNCDGIYNFMCANTFHPMYLSHWLMNLEGIDLMKEESA